MHDDRVQVERRLDRAMRDWIRPALYPRAQPMVVEAWFVPDEPVPFAQALTASYRPFEVGETRGAPWSTTWFRVTGTIPDEFAGRHVEAVFDLGFSGGPGFSCEAMAYDADGHCLKALHPLNRYVPVAESASAGQTVSLLVEAAANPAVLNGFAPTTLGDRLTAGDEPLHRFRQADLAVLNDEVFALIADIEVLDELMRELPVETSRRHEILRALERMLDVLDLHNVPATASRGRAELAAVLARPAYASAHRVMAAGHAHIDSAWLWPQREAARKAARTFANVTALAQDYPELLFVASQAQQYAWVKQSHPEVFARIKDAVANGTWSPVGSMWVESDANLPSGESLVRQIVHGKRFFAEELGVDTRGIWLPDSFGYTASFPQIARLAGLDWFLTQKLSWNQTNKLPHHTLWWEGIDGSRIFTHCPPADTYNGTFAASELHLAERQYAEKGVGTVSLLPFGHGDGGGGPTREMLERSRRLRDLEGSPRVAIAHPDEFFETARAEYEDAPVWRGELYLELHRATYTTQAKMKQGNRRSEHLLRAAELWATTATLHTDAPYPYEQLDALWKTVLLHQFHDILPGSSIAWVHREARDTYRRVHRELTEIVQAAMLALAGSRADLGSGSESASASESSSDSNPGPDDVWLFNAGPRRRLEVVEVPGALAAGVRGGADVSDGGSQLLSGGDCALLVDVPALTAVPGFTPPTSAGAVKPVTVDGLVLDNGLVRVAVDEGGLIGSVYDRTADRELLAPGGLANLLQLHPDHPNAWDAWDIDRHYLHRHVDLLDAESVEVVDAGPLQATIRVVRTFGAGSRIRQDIVLRAASKRVDIRTDIDWQESEKVLKAAFALDVHAEHTAAEIPFGHVRRPTHTNTSWDIARFETCAHRWVLVAEPGYGAALITDSTYGHDVRRDTREDGGTTTTLRLTLLRAPHSPDPHADAGTHQFTYSLLPGADVAAAVAEGYALNLPMPAVAVAGGRAPREPVVSVDGDAVIVEAVKLAEDRSGDVIVRLYESLGSRAQVQLHVGFAVEAGIQVDLLEAELPGQEALLVDGDSIPLEFRPFQIRTLRLRPRPRPRRPSPLDSSGR